jgi:hypothetical protein
MHTRTPSTLLQAACRAPPRPQPNKDLRCQDLLNRAGYTGQQRARGAADLHCVSPSRLGRIAIRDAGKTALDHKVASDNAGAHKGAWGRAQNDRWVSHTALLFLFSWPRRVMNHPRREVRGGVQAICGLSAVYALAAYRMGCLYFGACLHRHDPLNRGLKYSLFGKSVHV